MENDAVLGDQTVIISPGKIASVTAGGERADPNRRGAHRGQGQIPDAGSGRNARAHSRWCGNGFRPSSARCFCMPPMVSPRFAGCWAIRGISSIANAQKKGKPSARWIYQSGPSFNAKTAATIPMAVEAVYRAEERRLRPAENPSGRAARCVRRARGKGRRTENSVRRPCATRLSGVRALEARFASIDHLDGYVEGLTPNPAADSQFFGTNLMSAVDESRFASLVSASKAAGVWQVPTQVLMDNLLNDLPTSTLVAAS